MAELTNMETKLGEVIGLAMAAQGAVDRVSKLVEKQGEDELVQRLQTMREEAAQAERSGAELAGSFEGKKTAIMKEAREVKAKAQKMMTTYLDRGSDALDGFEFLTMAEAAEVGHWTVLGEMNKKARNPGVRQLVQAQMPIQKRHFKEVQQASVALATAEDPDAAA